jgi:hypothetical protein
VSGEEVQALVERLYSLHPRSSRARRRSWRQI